MNADEAHKYVMRDHSEGNGPCRGSKEPGYVIEFRSDSGFRKFRCGECGYETFGYPRRPNEGRVRYDRDTMIDILNEWFDMDTMSAGLAMDDYEKRRREGADKPCQSIVYHGAGHQSETYCEVKGGPENHDVSNGKVIHIAGYMEWTDDDPYDRN